MTTITKQAAIEAIEAQKASFASNEYAVGQPLSSFAERFACDQIIAALNALPAVTVTDEMAHRAQQKLRIHVGSSLIFPSINEVRAALEAALDARGLEIKEKNDDK